MIRSALLVAAGAALGVMAAGLVDRSRRARLRQQAAAMPRRAIRRGVTSTSRRVRYVRGVARGRLHRVRHPFGHAPDDDVTLVQKVRSEVLGADEFSRASLTVDAIDGEVTLRGQLERPEAIEALGRRVSKVRGVRAVENLVHVPGTPAPNKRAALEA